MKKFIIIFSIILLGVIGYTLIPALTRPGKITVSYDEAKILPRVLFLTTGGLEGNGEISEGVVVAIQSFNKNGSFVWLNDREVLLEPNVLSKYSFLIIPTSIGYHDGDRKYSLTFLSDLEMQNIINWVKNGGTLIAEENIGRNTIDGDDRVNISGELNPETWKLSELFGIKMKERDLDGFSIEEKNSNIWKGKIKEPLQENEWVLVPSEIISDKLKVLAEWVNGDERIPAIIGNDYGKGKAILLTTTYLLHPSNDGGISSIEQIENFYNYILEDSDSKRKFEISLNPWPHGTSSAFCISFNSLGNEEQLKRVINFLMIEKLPATFFIDSSLSPGQKNILEENKNISIQSNLFSRTDFSAATHFDVARAILMNEQNFGKAFTGLRFPYSSTNFWGLIYANDKGYIFDSSIGVDHLTSYAGSVFPYNIPVARDSYFKTLDLIEICPVKNDDIFYFIKSETEKEYTDEMQKEDALLYEKYLTDF
ncbi:MAG: beta-galactosidase trimerization domain-containing protein, partial [bacterium]